MLRDFGRRLPMGAKVISQIQRSPQMSVEQGPGWLSGWGGSGGYIMQARLTMPERVTYNAYLQGYNTQNDIVSATGLLKGEVSSALSSLERKSLVEPGVVTP